MKETLRKQKLFFISLIGIVVVSLVMGTTFAYQTIKINGESERVLVLESGVLDVAYKRTNLINNSNMPLLTSYKFSEDFTEFTVDNTGSNADVAFKISLAGIEYGYIDKTDNKNEEISGCRTSPESCIIDENFKFTIVELVDDKEILKTEGDFRDLATTEVALTNYLKIEKGRTKTYRLYLWLNETEDNQNHLENTYFKGKIVINSIFDAEAPKYLASVIMEDTRIIKNEDTPSFTGVETNEVGMYRADDDYGTSWYFRGKQSYNYVNFAGFTWRIVRINGDGSIRLILDGSLDKVKKNNIFVYTNSKLSALDSDGKVVFNTNSSDNAYIGYMYGNFTTNSNSYDQAHENKNDSTIKKYIDTFYEEYLSDYSDDLADTLFCGDKTSASSYAYGYPREYVGYSVASRLTGATAYPKLVCAEGANNTYSRYTSNSTITTNGVLVNNDLKYPIGLLSADELVFAGGYYGLENNSYYLHDAFVNKTLNSYWWTMSPYSFHLSGGDASSAHMFFGYEGNNSLRITYVYNTILGVRPVINLKADSLISSGDGTSGSPYTIEEI